MGPTWVMLVPDGPHVGPMNLAIMGDLDVCACPQGQGTNTLQEKVNLEKNRNKWTGCTLYLPLI